MQHVFFSPSSSSYRFEINFFFQYQFHSKTDDVIEKTLTNMSQGMINKLVSVLEATLSKLSRYDEGSLIGSILSFTVSSCKLSVFVRFYDGITKFCKCD